MVRALEMLAKTEKLDKGIPDIHKRTIDFLIERGRCICGNPIDSDSPEHKELMELLSYIPPQSLGTMINSFIKECKLRSESADDLFKTISDKLTQLGERENSNAELSRTIHALE